MPTSHLMQYDKKALTFYEKNIIQPDHPAILVKPIYIQFTSNSKNLQSYVNKPDFLNSQENFY